VHKLGVIGKIPLDSPTPKSQTGLANESRNEASLPRHFVPYVWYSKSHPAEYIKSGNYKLAFGFRLSEESYQIEENVSLGINLKARCKTSENSTYGPTPTDYY